MKNLVATAHKATGEHTNAVEVTNVIEPIGVHHLSMKAKKRANPTRALCVEDGASPSMLINLPENSGAVKSCGKPIDRDSLSPVRLILDSRTAKSFPRVRCAANVEGSLGQGQRAATLSSTWLVRHARAFRVTGRQAWRTTVELGGASALKGGR